MTGSSLEHRKFPFIWSLSVLQFSFVPHFREIHHWGGFRNIQISTIYQRMKHLEMTHLLLCLLGQDNTSPCGYFIYWAGTCVYVRIKVSHKWNPTYKAWRHSSYFCLYKRLLRLCPVDHINRVLESLTLASPLENSNNGWVLNL